MVYKIQFDIKEKKNDIFTVLESLGDFLIFKNDEYVINTKRTKTTVKNKLKKLLSKNEDVFITQVKEEQLSYYPDVVKTWFLLNKIQSQIDEISPEQVAKEALRRLDSFVNCFEEELKKNEIKPQ